MKAGEILIGGIFNRETLLEVPFYQRGYVWDIEQWDRFLEDMETVSRTNQQYFLGSIILKNGEAPNTWENYSARKIVIDGQQRLTTLIILMKVLSLKAGSPKDFGTYLLEDGVSALLHGKNDIDAFEKVISAENAIEIKNTQPESKIISAFNYFLKSVDDQKLNKNIIKQKVQFVCIDLDEDEDEQQVFNTINSLGVRLTTAELLKNYFFNRDNIDEYEKKWVSVFERDDEARIYWDQTIETGRITRSLIDIFFDAYFQLFLQSKTYKISSEDKEVYSRVDNLAKSYQSFIHTYCNDDKSVVLAEMADYAKVFEKTFVPAWCERAVPKTASIERINVIVFGLKNSTLIPYLLYVAKNVDENEQNKIYAVLENYIMRRMVVHATTKNYNNLFEKLILNKVNTASMLISELTKIEETTTTYLPDDKELLDGFNNSKLVNLQTRGILYLIESAIRPENSSTALLGFDGYSLEHMMPKKWRNNWEPCQTEELEKARDSKLLTLGNLAIITQSLNSSIRDGNWDTKKVGKKDDQGLNLCAAGLSTMQDVLQKEEWNEIEIASRAIWLYEQAKTIWPYDMGTMLNTVS